MRRGSAVLLTILPLLSPAYGLPTYFGNDNAVAHANVERAALPEPALNLDTAEMMNEKRAAEDVISDWESEAVPEWLPKHKRQSTGGSDGLSSGTVTLDVSGAENPPTTGRVGQPDSISNLGSEGPANWLRPTGQTLKERDLTEREAEAEPNPAVTLDMNYRVPDLDTGNMNLGAPPIYKRRVLSV